MGGFFYGVFINMPERQPQQLFWNHEFGVIEAIPPHATANIARVVFENQPLPNTEGERLRRMTIDKSMKKKYPTSQHGVDFMSEVNYGRCEELFAFAQELAFDTSEETPGILTSWQKINPNKPITIALFGSVAKALTKKSEHCDPSNIDLAVGIEGITQEEQQQLFDAIRSKREDIKKRILSGCPNTAENSNGGNAGVHIQNLTKLKRAMLTYVASGAYPLYGHEIWHQIEEEEISASAQKTIAQLNGGKTHRENSMIKRLNSLEAVVFEREAVLA